MSAECLLPAERLEREGVSKDLKCTAVAEALLRKVRAIFLVDRQTLTRHRVREGKAMRHLCALG